MPLILLGLLNINLRNEELAQWSKPVKPIVRLNTGEGERNVME